jgi:hypothetical protein
VPQKLTEIVSDKQGKSGNSTSEANLTTDTNYAYERHPCHSGVYIRVQLAETNYNQRITNFGKNLHRVVRKNFNTVLMQRHRLLVESSLKAKLETPRQTEVKGI